MSGQYAGDVTSQEAWTMLERDPRAVLLDVRTDAEWRFVGLPDLSVLEKRTLQVSWQEHPELNFNPDFVKQVAAHGLASDQPFLIICRSGVRSRHAAVSLTAHGYSRCYNVSDGFEGGHDEERHRGAREGWKATGLPWRQD
jgi:rhodanese-related sulfurtransferase